MDFQVRLDRREYHEEYWQIYTKHFNEKVVFASEIEFEDWYWICAKSAFDEFKDNHSMVRIDFYDWFEIVNDAVEDPTECPTCGELQNHALYMGMPMMICKDPECATMTGAGSWIAENIYFDGCVFLYRGSYWGALKSFLFDGDLEDPIDYN